MVVESTTVAKNAVCTYVTVSLGLTTTSFRKRGKESYASGIERSVYVQISTDLPDFRSPYVPFTCMGIPLVFGETGIAVVPVQQAKFEFSRPLAPVHLPRTSGGQFMALVAWHPRAPRL